MRARYEHALRAYKGLIILYDSLPTGNTTWNGPLDAGRKRFGVDADDVRFLPYWDKASGVGCATKDVYIAGWLRPGKLAVPVPRHDYRQIIIEGLP